MQFPARFENPLNNFPFLTLFPISCNRTTLNKWGNWCGVNEFRFFPVVFLCLCKSHITTGLYCFSLLPLCLKLQEKFWGEMMQISKKQIRKILFYIGNKLMEKKLKVIYSNCQINNRSSNA